MERNHESRASRTPSERVVEAVAAERNGDVLDLPPLYDAIDPDALNVFVRELGDGEIRFSYADRTVTVSRDGSVDVGDGSATGSERTRRAADD